jgi:hypothetical protein
MSHDTEATSSKRQLRKYESAIDTSCAFETFQHTHEKNNTQKPDWVKHKYKYDNTK